MFRSPDVSNFADRSESAVTGSQEDCHATASLLYSEVETDRLEKRTTTTRGSESEKLDSAKLADCAEDQAKSWDTVGRSYRAVKQLLKPMMELPGHSAYMAAEALRKDDRFEEIPVDKAQPGDIKVFGPTDRARHGHSVIQLSGNREASDHISRNTDADNWVRQPSQQPTNQAGHSWATAFRLKK